MAELCFTARALAQTHPMSAAAHHYRQQCTEHERQRQHIGEPADWAGTALLVGYCLRRAEEQRSDIELADVGEPARHQITTITDVLRNGAADSVSLLPAAVTVAALDQLIATELDKRQEHLREQLDDDAWSELEDYIAWWVIHGYALRASERPRL